MGCNVKAGKETANNSVDSLPAISIPSAPVTSLPFGPKMSSADGICAVNDKFYYDLIGKGFRVSSGFKEFTNSYKLPPIKKYKYTIVDTNYEGSSCSNNIPIDSLISVKEYKIRLPDYEGFEVYYMTDDDEYKKDISDVYKGACGSFYYRLYGILILYERKTEIARLLPVFYDHYSESVKTRHFYIDKNYRILLCNKRYDEGHYTSGSPVDKATGPLYEVKISKSGDFLIKMIADER